MDMRIDFLICTCLYFAKVECQQTQKCTEFSVASANKAGRYGGHNCTNSDSPGEALAQSRTQALAQSAGTHGFAVPNPEPQAKLMSHMQILALAKLLSLQMGST